MVDLTAYVKGDITVATQIISQVVMVTSGGAFQTAAKVAIIAGIIVGMFKGLLQGGKLELMHFIWPIFIVLIGVFPRVNLVIENPTTGALSRINGVPVIVAGPVSIITGLGQGLTNMMEASFGLDDERITMENGALASLRAPIIFEEVLTNQNANSDAALSSSGIDINYDPKNYVKECVLYALNHDAITINTLLTSDISTAFKTPDFAFDVPKTNGANVKCSAYFDEIMAYITGATFQGKLQTAVAKYAGTNNNDLTSGSKYWNALDDVVDDRNDFIATVVWRHAFMNGQVDFSLAGSGGTFATTVNDALAQRTAQSMGSAAIVFETLSTMIGFIEAWSFAITPIMILVMLFGIMGAGLGAKYFWLLIWIQLWEPTILIVLDYMDAQSQSLALAGPDTITSLSAYMTHLYRLQDVGYMQLSGATMLSMFLIFGSSAVFGTAMQRSMAGADHFNEKNIHPDTMSRAPHVQFGSDFEYSKATGYEGTNAARAFGDTQFGQNYSFGSNVSSTKLAQIASGATSSVSKAGDFTSSSGSSRLATDNVSSGRSQSAGITLGRNASGALDLSSGSLVTGNTTGSDTNIGQTTLGANVGADVSAGAGLRTPMLPGGSAAKLGPSLSGQISGGVRAGVQNTDQVQHGNSFGSGTSEGTGARYSFGNSGTTTKGDQVTKGKSTTVGESQESRLSFSQATRASNAENQSETATESLNKTAADSYTKTVGTTAVSGIAAANNMAKDSRIMSSLRSDLETAGALGDVNSWISRNRERLDLTFMGPDAEEAKFAYGAQRVLQGMDGNGRLSPERAEARNALGDYYLDKVRFAGNPSPDAPDRGLEGLKPVNGDVSARAGEMMGGFYLEKATVEKAIDGFDFSGNLDEDFERFKGKLGTEFSNLDDGQMNSIFSTMRTKLDAQRENINDSDGYTARTREDGLIGYIRSGIVGESESDQIATGNMYRDMKGDTPEQTFENRMEAFSKINSPNNSGEAAQFMALAQLYAGAGIAGDTEAQSKFGGMMQSLQETSPGLQGEVGERIADLAIDSVREKGMGDRLNHAEAELNYGALKNSVESGYGIEVDDTGKKSEWGGGQDGGEIASRLMHDLQRDFGFNTEQAAGVVGNLSHESSGFKELQEIKPVIPGSRGGTGYAMWTGPRRREFEEWSNERGLDTRSYDANYGFLRHEMTNSAESGVVDRILKTETADEAAITFSKVFLRPGIPHNDRRVQLAREYAQG